MNTLIESNSHSDPKNGLSICLENVSVRFRLPHQRFVSFKEYAIHWLRRRVRYEDFWALRDVNLDVARGECVGIIGSNGAGKSTLLRVVAQILRPKTGRVRVWGKVAPLIELGAGFELELSARENVVLNGAALGRTRREVRARLDAIVDFAELRDFLDVPLRNYSTGMVARLAFAIATDVESDVLIVDEVLSVGDNSYRKKSSERIDSFRAHGTSILLVSHNLPTIAEMCQRVVWLEKGLVREMGEAHTVLANYSQSLK